MAVHEEIDIIVNILCHFRSCKMYNKLDIYSSAGGLLVLDGIIHLVVSVLALKLLMVALHDNISVHDGLLE